MISKNLAQRLAVAAVAIPAILFMVFRGGDIFLYFIILLAALGMYEYLRGSGLKIYDIYFLIPFAGVVGSVYLTATGQPLFGGYCLLGVFLITGILLATGKDTIENIYSRLTYIVWGSLYLGLLYPFVYLIRGEAGWMEPAPGRWWLFLLLGALWLGDTAAMFMGKSFGRHKLAPTVSPNKTIEGFIGGFIGVIVVAMIFRIFWLQDVAAYHFIIISLLIGLFGQLGDLVESLWKRYLGIKDSSAIIPGHGGVLDRFDSLLFSAPVVFLYIKYILRPDWM